VNAAMELGGKRYVFDVPAKSMNTVTLGAEDRAGH